MAALEADGAEPFKRLVQRNGLVVNAEVVDSLLAPREGGSLWRTIVLQPDKHSVIETLLAQDQALAHPRLRAAALAIAESSPVDGEGDGDAGMEGEGEETDEEMEEEQNEDESSGEGQMSDASDDMTE